MSASIRISRPRRGQGGFTLAELLVTIGIIALLISLLIPVLGAVMRQGDSARITATLRALDTGLEQYRSDFGDYPRFSLDDPNFPNPLNAAPDRGARLLARALFGPAPANDPRISHDLSPSGPYASPSDYLNASKMAFQDGHGDAANPFGHKQNRQVIQRGGETGAYYAGKAFSYLDAERFQLRKIGDVVRAVPPPIGENDSLVAASAAFQYGVDTVILDPSNGEPILYYPALAKQPVIGQQAARAAAFPAQPAAEDPAVPFNFAAQLDPVGLFVDTYRPDQPQQSLFNAFDNIGYAPNPYGGGYPDDGRRWQGLSMDDPHPTYNTTRFFLRELLGDTNQNGFIDLGEKAASTGPYLLITGGVDGFGLFQQNIADPAAVPANNDPYFWSVSTPIANFDVSHTK